MPTFDAATTNDAGSSSSFSFTHTPVGTPTFVVLLFVNQHGSAGELSSATYGGEAMTRQGFIANGTDGQAEVWYKNAPLSGAQTVAGTLSAKRQNREVAVTYTGAIAATPMGTYASATGNDTTPTVAVASAVNDMVVEATEAHGGNSDSTPGASQTQRMDISKSLASDELAVGISTTMSWTVTTDTWGIGGAAIKAAGPAASEQLERRLSQSVALQRF